MRDILVTIIFFGALPLVFKKPQIGVYLWAWIGYMNPHRLGWGFAYNFPFGVIAAAAIILSLVIARKNITYFWSPIFSLLIILNIWFLITTFFSIQPDISWTQWEKVIKIQLIALMIPWIINDKEKIHNFIWVIALSIGYYGIKGGVFTLTTGGSQHVLGPAGSFISGNTEIGLALVSVFPLFWYLYLNTIQPWLRSGLVFAMILIPVAILGTQSRGALLAIVAIGFFLWLKSRKKLAPFIVIILFAPLLYNFMPDSWHQRMGTISSTGEERDSSAKGRLLAWEFATKLALARPLGGGFECFTKENYLTYAPDIVAEGGRYQDAHSIYFELIGEHGFIGLIIYLSLLVMGWKTASTIIKISKTSLSNKWAYDLASMIQVSIVGYAVGGAFLGLSYFDLLYHYFVILAVLLKIVRQSVTENSQSSTTLDHEHLILKNAKITSKASI